MPERRKSLSCGLGDLSITPNPRWGGFKHLILFSIKYALLQQGLTKSNLILREIDILNLFKPQFHLSCSSSLWRGEHNTSKPSRRQQPPRVTSWLCLLEESLVPQSSNHSNQALDPHTLTVDQRTLVWGREVLAVWLTLVAVRGSLSPLQF
jgi:hypothetical protein